MPQSKVRLTSSVLVAAALLISLIIYALDPPYIQQAKSHLPFVRHGKASSETLANEAIAYSTADHDATKAAPDPNHRYAYVTFLQGNAQHEDIGGDPMDDEYFVSVRVLGYQLMHSPKTGTNESIPYVVCVSHTVSEEKRRILEEDGAVVVLVETVPNPDWLSTDGIDIRWKDLMTKLRIFQLTQYERILYTDADMIILKPMDGIFNDPSARPLSTVPDIPQTDVTRPPSTYVFAAQAQARWWTHPYPPASDNDYFGAGFMLIKPDNQLFDHYISILQVEGLFTTNMMEQNLLNYAHRRDGPMPWQDVHYTWTSTYPTWNEYKAGAHSLHHKWWSDEWYTQDNDEKGRRSKLMGMWWRVRGEMEGYYLGRRRKGLKGGP